MGAGITRTEGGAGGVAGVVPHYGLDVGGLGRRGAHLRLEDDKDRQHECHICGLGFEMGQALGGHMRRHREEKKAALSGGEERRIIALPGQEVVGHGADRPPVLLELFV